MTTLSEPCQIVTLAAHQHPYARVYQAVILRAVHDLGYKKHQGEAREWLLSPESDYAFAAAGISPLNDAVNYFRFARHLPGWQAAW